MSGSVKFVPGRDLIVVMGWDVICDGLLTEWCRAVYKDMSEAVQKHPEADILVNFVSLRSA